MSLGTVVLRMLSEISRTNRSLLLTNHFRVPVSKVFARSYCDPSGAENIEGEEISKKTESQGLETSAHDPKDRSVPIPVETSIRYMKSRAYFQAYGDEPVWVPYRRNFRGHYQPRLTRKSCIVKDRVISGNPCPLCRDEYLVLHETNVDLLKQFISPHTGAVLHWLKTGVCQRKYDSLMVNILKARDLGLLTFDVPFRNYD